MTKKNWSFCHLAHCNCDFKCAKGKGAVLPTKERLQNAQIRPFSLSRLNTVDNCESATTSVLKYLECIGLKGMKYHAFQQSHMERK